MAYTKLNTFHLFAGAGGGILGDLLLGHNPIGACEIEPLASQALFAPVLTPQIALLYTVHATPLPGAGFVGEISQTLPVVTRFTASHEFYDDAHVTVDIIIKFMRSLLAQAPDFMHATKVYGFTRVTARRSAAGARVSACVSGTPATGRTAGLLCARELRASCRVPGGASPPPGARANNTVSIA